MVGAFKTLSQDVNRGLSCLLGWIDWEHLLFLRGLEDCDCNVSHIYEAFMHHGVTHWAGASSERVSGELALSESGTSSAFIWQALLSKPLPLLYCFLLM